MGCEGCKDKQFNRYDSRGIPMAEEGRRNMPPPPPSPEPRLVDSAPNFERAYEEVNNYSFDTLLSMKNDVEKKEQERYRSSLKAMSEDLRAIQVLAFVNIINGDEFSATGQSPEYCITFLKNALDLPEMDSVNIRWPNLKDSIKVRYESLLARRIVL